MFMKLAQAAVASLWSFQGCQYAGMQNAIEELDRLESAFDHVKGQLLDRLHEVVRQQLFHKAPAVQPSKPPRGQPKALPAVSVDRQLPDSSEAGSNGASQLQSSTRQA